MKKLYTALYAVLVVCAAGTAVLLLLSPDQIPAHYNFAGEVDRMGSRYENLIFPGLAIAMGAFFLLMAKYQGKKGRTLNEKVLLYTGICTLAFFTLLGFYFMVKAIRYDPAAPRSSLWDVNRFTGIGIGVLLILLGYPMPKAERNAVYGLRTRWSMANDRVWQKSQQFGGRASMIAGGSMIVLALFIPGLWNLLMVTVVILIWLVACVLASRRYYLEDQRDNL